MSAPAMTRSMWPTSSERTSSTSAALSTWATSLAARADHATETAMFGRDARTVGAATGDATKLSAQTDRPTGAISVQAASPGTSQGSIPPPSPSLAAVAMRDEWRGRSSGRDLRCYARRHFSPRSTGASRTRHPRCHATAGAWRCGGALRRWWQGAAAPSRRGRDGGRARAQPGHGARPRAER